LPKNNKPNSVKMVIYLEPVLRRTSELKFPLTHAPKWGCTKQGLPRHIVAYITKRFLSTFHSRVRDIVSVALSLPRPCVGAVAVSHCFIIMVFGLSSPTQRRGDHTFLSLVILSQLGIKVNQNNKKTAFNSNLTLYLVLLMHRYLYFHDWRF